MRSAPVDVPLMFRTPAAPTAITTWPFHRKQQLLNNVVAFVCATIAHSKKSRVQADRTLERRCCTYCSATKSGKDVMRKTNHHNYTALLVQVTRILKSS